MWMCSADDFQVVYSSISRQHDCIRCSKWLLFARCERRGHLNGTSICTVVVCFYCGVECFIFFLLVVMPTCSQQSIDHTTNHSQCFEMDREREKDVVKNVNDKYFFIAFSNEWNCCQIKHFRKSNHSIHTPGRIQKKKNSSVPIEARPVRKSDLFYEIELKLQWLRFLLDFIVSRSVSKRWIEEIGHFRRLSCWPRKQSLVASNNI